MICCRPAARSIPRRRCSARAGQVLEHGQPRFFRRLAEGVFDEEDLIRRTHELGPLHRTGGGVITGWTRPGSSRPAIPTAPILPRAFCSCARSVLCGAALLRPMVPLIPESLPALAGLPVLVAAGRSRFHRPRREYARAGLAPAAGRGGRDALGGECRAWPHGGHAGAYPAVAGRPVPEGRAARGMVADPRQNRARPARPMPFSALNLGPKILNARAGCRLHRADPDPGPRPSRKSSRGMI